MGAGAMTQIGKSSYCKGKMTMIIKKIKNIDTFYENLHTVGMQCADNIKFFNPFNTFYSTELGVYYRIKGRFILLYYEDGTLGKNGLPTRYKAYMMGGLFGRKNVYFCGINFAWPWSLVFLLAYGAPFIWGITIAVAVIWLTLYSEFKELIHFIDKITKM